MFCPLLNKIKWNKIKTRHVLTHTAVLQDFTKVKPPAAVKTHRLQEGESAHIISLGVQQLVQDTQPQAKLALRVFTPRLLGVFPSAVLLHVPRRKSSRKPDATLAKTLPNGAAWMLSCLCCCCCCVSGSSPFHRASHTPRQPALWKPSPLPSRWNKL